MKWTTFFINIIFASLLFFPSCIRTGNDSVIVAPSETRNSNDGTGLCRDDDNCEEICEDVYDDSGDEENYGKVETCLDLRYSIAIQFEDIMEFLEEPHDADLRNINNRAFMEFLDVSLEPWVQETREASDSEAEALLVWIAKSSKISSAIEDAYENYEREYDKFEGVANLFEQIASNVDGAGCSGDERECAEMFNVITEKAIVGTRTSFWDILEESSNTGSAKMITCEIFDQRCDSIGLGSCDISFSAYSAFETACDDLLN